MKKVKTAVMLAAVMLLTACEPISQELPEMSLSDEYSRSDESGYREETEETEEETVSYTEYVAEVPEIVNAEANMIIEAEDCKLGGSLYT